MPGVAVARIIDGASMKALPKRKGNFRAVPFVLPYIYSLNESPSKKEGKWFRLNLFFSLVRASMKALPKRKGNHGVRPRCIGR